MGCCHVELISCLTGRKAGDWKPARVLGRHQDVMSSHWAHVHNMLHIAKNNWLPLLLCIASCCYKFNQLKFNIHKIQHGNLKLLRQITNMICTEFTYPLLLWDIIVLSRGGALTFSFSVTTVIDRKECSKSTRSNMQLPDYCSWYLKVVTQALKNNS